MESNEHWRELNRVLHRSGIREPASVGDLAQYSTLDLLSALQTFLGELSARAIQNSDVAESLWTFAHTACADVWEVCERKPEIIRPFAPKKMTFPVHWPLLKKHQEQVAAMIEKLGVGTQAIYRLPRKKKQFDPTTSANSLVLRWVEHIHKVQHEKKAELAGQFMAAIMEGKRPDTSVTDHVESEIAKITEPSLQMIMGLPPLNRASADKWAGVVWKMVLGIHEGHPEKNRELRSMGNYRARHHEVTGARKATGRTAAANVRDGIKRRIFKSFRELVRAA